MKLNFRLPICIILILLTVQISIGQEKPLSETYKKASIEKLTQLINDFYVSEDVGMLTVKHLKDRWAKGYFNDFTNYTSFATALTETVQDINKDKHMRIWKNKPYNAPVNTPERWIDELLTEQEWLQNNNFGFKSAKVLDGNVGYLDLQEFSPFSFAKSVTDSYMKLLSNCNAIIIDLSKNGGGDPNMVQYLCSYFFKENILLNSLYWREGERTQEFWTINVDGERMIDIPLFIITSESTFSAAEEFSYNMQTQKRAIIIGQTTGGGANPGNVMNINENLSVFIPLGKAINPITKTNWEGIGVIPDIKANNDEAYNTAINLALTSAKDYVKQSKKDNKEHLSSLINSIKDIDSKENEKQIYNKIKHCLDLKLLNEAQINSLGYAYLIQYKKPKAGELILKTNIEFFPKSANAFDSYAEALMTNGKFQSALKFSKKSIELATKTKDQSMMDLCKRSLERIKKRME